MPRPRLFNNPEVVEQIIADYTLRSRTTTELANQWSTSPSTIRRYLIERGVQLRPRGRRPAIVRPTPAPEQE
jgi:transposase-like protein